MSPEEKKEVISLITSLFISKGKPMPDGTGPVWIADLQDLPIDQLREAFKIERRDGNHEWPVLGHLLKHLDNVESEAHDQFDLIDKFRGWHSDIGWTKARTWNDAAERALREVGGIAYFNGISDYSFPFLKKDFVEAYERSRNDLKVRRLEIENDDFETKSIE